MLSGCLVCVICNSNSIQTLHNYCLHIEDLYFPFCAHLMDIFSNFWGVFHIDIFPSEMPSKCNQELQEYSSFYIQTLHNSCSHIEDVHLLFYAHFTNIFFIFGVLNLDFFSLEMLRWFLVCVICNSSSFHSFIFKLCNMIEHVHPIFVHIWLYIFECSN